MLGNIRITIIKEEEIKIYNNIIYDALRSEIKGNKTHKDYNALIDLIRVEIRGVFFYQHDHLLRH
jgi:hypothetical protein